MKLLEPDCGYGETWEHDGIKFHVSHAALITAKNKDTERAYFYAKKLKELDAIAKAEGK